MLKSVRHLVVAAVLVAALALFGALSFAQDDKVLVIGHAEATDSFDPQRAFTQTTGFLHKVIYETLVTFPSEDAGSILPALAESWSVSDDGLTYTFNLREGVLFSTGNPLTAADVVFSLNRLKNLKDSPAFLADNIASVEAVDDLTVTITLTAENPAFLSRLPNSVFQIVDSQTVIANGGTDAENAAEVDTAEDFLNANSVGTGPYMLESWEPQVQTTLVRNPNWRGELPYFDRIIVTNIPEAATQKIALEAGDIDLALDLTADQISTMGNNPDISIFRGPGNIVHFLLMNADPTIGGPMSDSRVQMAVRLALDYEGYKALWGGVNPAANLAVGLLGALDPSEALTRDLDRARELLAEAGYADGLDVTLQYPDFSFQGVNMNTNAQKIVADLAEAGIRVTLQPGELQVSLQQYRAGEQGFGYWFWGPDILDPSDFLSFLPGGKVGFERAKWSLDMVDPEIAQMIRNVAGESDQETRLAMYAELQRWAQQNGIFAPFIQPDIQTAFRADLLGYSWHPQWLFDASLLSRAE